MTRQSTCSPAKGPTGSQGRPSEMNKEDALVSSASAGLLGLLQLLPNSLRPAEKWCH